MTSVTVTSYARTVLAQPFATDRFKNRRLASRRPGGHHENPFQVFEEDLTTGQDRVFRYRLAF